MLDAAPWPTLTVCVVTYNQEKYIRQCLQSLVDQKTSFVFDIVVGEDCSTDGTAAIVREFAANYPALVKPTFHFPNLGGSKNVMAMHACATGRYIAHVDGDDYALPGKLQALVEALERDPGVNVAWHRQKILDDATGTFHDDLIDMRLQPARGFTRRDLLACGTVGGNSASIYRASVRDKLDHSIPEMMDFYVTVERVGDGRAVWVDGFYGVYRRDVGIMAGGGTKYKRLFVDHLLYFLKKFPECRREINALATLLVLADLKNRRALTAGRLWLASFHPLSPVEFIRRLPLYRILRLPKASGQ